MTAPLFDIEPHGTPCLICGELSCVCRSAGTLEATPGAWPIDRPATPASGTSERNDPAQVEERRAMFEGLGWTVTR